jgi:hypothetical protein
MEGRILGKKSSSFWCPNFLRRAKVVWYIQRHRKGNDQLLSPQKKSNLLLVPHVHLDVGYADIQ